jgi:hypothetical protein
MGKIRGVELENKNLGFVFTQDFVFKRDSDVGSGVAGSDLGFEVAVSVVDVDVLELGRADRESELGSIDIGQIIGQGNVKLSVGQTGRLNNIVDGVVGGELGLSKSQNGEEKDQEQTEKEFFEHEVIVKKF